MPVSTVYQEKGTQRLKTPLGFRGQVHALALFYGEVAGAVGVGRPEPGVDVEAHVFFQQREMFALRPTSYEASEKMELKAAALPAKMRPKTYDEIRAKVLEAPRTILTQKGKKK